MGGRRAAPVPRGWQVAVLLFVVEERADDTVSIPTPAMSREPSRVARAFERAEVSPYRARPRKLLAAFQFSVSRSPTLGGRELSERGNDRLAVPSLPARSKPGGLDASLPRAEEGPDIDVARPSRVFPSPLAGCVRGGCPLFGGRHA